LRWKGQRRRGYKKLRKKKTAKKRWIRGVQQGVVGGGQDKEEDVGVDVGCSVKSGFFSFLFQSIKSRS